MSDRKYPFIDGLRAIAVYWVVAHHLFFSFNIKFLFTQIGFLLLDVCQIDLFKLINFFVDTAQRITLCGTLGVDMFFVISGFLITGLLLKDLNKEINVRRFYARRFFKIFPQYFLAIITALILYKYFSPSLTGIVPQSSVGTNLFGYMFFLQNFFPPIPLLGHTWSLVIEEQFYLFYPIIMLIIFKWVRPKARIKTLIMLAVSVIVLCNIGRFIHFHSDANYMHTALKSPHIFQTTLFRMDALAMGSLLKLIEPVLRAEKLYWKFLTPTFFVASIWIYALFILGFISQGGFTKDSWFSYTLGYVAPACLFIAGYRGFRPLLFIIENPVAIYLGRNSYGIYLWHFILIAPARLLISEYGILSAIVIYLVVATSVGIITTSTIEKYFLKIREKVAPQKADTSTL